MLKFLRRRHKTTFVLGFISFYCAFSTSDYHTMLLEDNPTSVGTLIWLGFFLLTPSIITFISEFFRD